MLAQTKRAEIAPTIPTLISSRLAGRININPRSMEVTVVTDITAGAPPTVVRTSNREEADNYRGHIVDLTANWRVVECSGGVQWILQRRRASKERVGGRWASVSFHRSRETLKVAITRRCGQVDPDEAEIIDALPAFIGGAR